MSLESISKFREAPITQEELKLNIFAPVDKINSKRAYKLEEVAFEDEHVKVSIKGVKLTQIHRDILDIALFYGDYTLEDKVSQNIPIRTFSLYRVQQLLKHKYNSNHKWLKDRFDELKLAVIEIYSKKNKESIQFNIVRVSKHSEKLNNYVLIFEELYFSFFEKAISISYKNLLDDIIDLKYPQTKACIRYLLTFKNGHQINIDKLLQRVGVIGGTRNIEKARRNVLSEFDVIKDKFNIELIKTSKDKRKKSDITVRYKRHDEVKIYYNTQGLDLFSVNGIEN
jgi:hypothetical protein